MYKEHERCKQVAKEVKLGNELLLAAQQIAEELVEQQLVSLTHMSRIRNSIAKKQPPQSHLVSINFESLINRLSAEIEQSANSIQEISDELREKIKDIENSSKEIERKMQSQDRNRILGEFERIKRQQTELSSGINQKLKHVRNEIIEYKDLKSKQPSYGVEAGVIEEDPLTSIVHHFSTPLVEASEQFFNSDNQSISFSTSVNKQVYEELRDEISKLQDKSRRRKMKKLLKKLIIKPSFDEENNEKSGVDGEIFANQSTASQENSVIQVDLNKDGAISKEEGYIDWEVFQMEFE